MKRYILSEEDIDTSNSVDINSAIDKAIDELFLDESIQLDEGFKDTFKRILSAGFEGAIGGMASGALVGGDIVGGLLSGAIGDIIKEIYHIIKEYIASRKEHKKEKQLELENELNNVVGEESADRMIGATNVLMKPVFEEITEDVPVEDNVIEPEQIDIEVKEPEKKQENIGISQMLSDLIKDEWEAIDGYKSTIATLTELGGNEEMIKVLEDISTEEMVHVGQLEKCMQLVSPEATEIKTGEKEAEEQLNNIVDEPVEEEFILREGCKKHIREELNDYSDQEIYDAIDNTGYSFGERYWMREVYFNLSNIYEQWGDDEINQKINRLNLEGIKKLCYDIASDILSNDYVWETLNETINNRIYTEIDSVVENNAYNDDGEPTEIDPDENNNPEGGNTNEN